MRYVVFNGLSGIDLSIPEEDLPGLINRIVQRIISYFTDEFEVAVRTPIGPDAIVTIKPLENKLFTRNMQEFEFSDKLKWNRWKYMVVSSLLETIQNSYGHTPYKEALDLINKTKYQDQTQTKSNGSKEIRLAYGLQKREEMDSTMQWLANRMSNGPSFSTILFGNAPDILGPNAIEYGNINSIVTNNQRKRITLTDPKTSPKVKTIFLKVPKSFWKDEEKLHNLIQNAFESRSVIVAVLNSNNPKKIRVITTTGQTYESEPHHTRENIIVFKAR